MDPHGRALQNEVDMAGSVDKVNEQKPSPHIATMSPAALARQAGREALLAKYAAANVAVQAKRLPGNDLKGQSAKAQGLTRAAPA